MLSGYIDNINERNEIIRLTGIYNSAITAMEAASTESSYKAAASTFKTISGFKDADSLAEQCLKKAEQCFEKAEQEKRKVLAVARALKEGGKTKAGPTLEEKLSVEKTRIGNLIRIQGTFVSTQAQIQALQSELNGAILQEKQLSERRSRLGIFAGKEKKRIDEELAGLLEKKSSLTKQISQFFEELAGYAALADVERDLNKARNSAADLEAQIESKRVHTGVEYTYKEALNIYLKKPDVAAAVNLIYPAAGFIPVMLGKRDTIYFGRYIQAKNGSPEPIEWQVLARENGRMLVISKYALDCQPYSTSYTSVTWETCSLRKWLNGSFFNAAFSSEEKKSRIRSTVTADKNPSYSTSPGKNTMDKVFLLSIDEVNKYFSSDSARQCHGTAYCFAQGAYKSAYSVCLWWLRTPGVNSHYAASVEPGNSVRDDGTVVDVRDYAVRPALLNLRIRNLPQLQRLKSQRAKSAIANVKQVLYPMQSGRLMQGDRI